jgi:hypothetical protein
MSDGGQVKVRKDGSSEVTSPSNPYDGMYGDGMMFYPKSLARHPDYRHWLEKALGAQAVGKGIYEWTDMPVPAPGKRSKGMAEGGIVQGAPFNPIEAGIASLVPPGGGASAMRQVDKEIVQQAIMSLTNQIESDEPVNRFIERFGKPALADLAQRIVEAEGQQNSGMMIAGPGDGLSDDIPAAAGRQPIQLSDGEWVIPADVVSSIGNGSTEAGSKQLQNMVRRVRMEKNNSSQQPPSIDPNKILPA